MTTRASSNHRPMIFDAEESARHYREVFTKKKVEKKEELAFTWPAEMQLVGDSLAVAYSSDKWKKTGEFELYKHLAESRNKVYVEKGFLYDYEAQRERVHLIGPTERLSRVPMPKHFAFLALFVEAHFSLFTEGTDKRPRFSKNPREERIVRVLVAHAMLGGGKIQWSKIDPQAEDQPFLFVYTLPTAHDPGGVHMIITGEELDIEADGIVG